MASVAVYRLNKFAKYGIPPYTSGCSPASLSVAQMLGWPSFAIFSIVFFCAISICSSAASKASSFSFGNVQYNLMPGSVAAGVSVAFQLIGCVLMSVVAYALKSMHGIGCNSGGCCKLTLNNGRLAIQGEQEKIISQSTSLLGEVRRM